MRPNNRLFVLLAALGLWLIASGFGYFVWIQANTRILALALLAFSITLALTNLFRYAGWLATALSIVIYALAQIGLNGVSPDIILLPIGLFSAGLVIAAVLSTAIAQEVVRLNRQLNNDQRLIEELRLFDPITGLMRYQQALRLLKSEILRSQRYEKKLCLFLIRVENLDEIQGQLGLDGVDATKRQVVGALMSSVRATDIPFGGEKFGAVLPETDLTGAKIMTDRLINMVVNKVRVPVNIGIAQFPDDGLSELELTQAAEAALHIASTTGKSYVQYKQIREMVEETKSGQLV